MSEKRKDHMTTKRQDRDRPLPAAKRGTILAKAAQGRVLRSPGAGRVPSNRDWYTSQEVQKDRQTIDLAGAYMPKSQMKEGYQKGPKRRISPVKAGAILAGAAQGKSQRQIAREVKVARKTVNRVLSDPEITAMLANEEREMKALVPKARRVYDSHLDDAKAAGSLPAARDVMFGFQILKPRSQHEVKHTTPLDAELERRGLSGRTLEELTYFVGHGYFPEEEAKYDGRRLGQDMPN